MAFLLNRDILNQVRQNCIEEHVSLLLFTRL